MHETEFCKQFLKVNQKHRNFVHGNQNYDSAMDFKIGEV